METIIVTIFIWYVINNMLGNFDSKDPRRPHVKPDKPTGRGLGGYGLR